MKFKLRKINHLIRYFIPFGIFVFFAYINNWIKDVALVLIGPVLYLAKFVRELVESAVTLPSSESVYFYGLLLPFTIAYFGFIAFLLKQLFNERGHVRLFSLVALVFFLVFIHFMSWKSLMDYYQVPA